MWSVFLPFFLSLLIADFLITHGGEVSVRKSLALTGCYILAAIAFGSYVLHMKGLGGASQFATIFCLEQLLSVDNLLVISLIFGYFEISKTEQHRALLFGIAGAICFRAAAIFAGTALIEKLNWLLYCFAAFLMFTGCNLMRGEGDEFDPEERKLICWLKRTFGPASMFFAAVLAVEFSDIIFAVDSIPASFSISRDPFVILTANLLAVAGLRSLYHAVAYGLSLVAGLERYIGLVLILLGGKVFVDHFVTPVPSWMTMAGVFTVLALGVLMSRRPSAPSAA